MKLWTYDGRTPEHGYTISSPCEPKGSGELKNNLFGLLITFFYEAKLHTKQKAQKALIDPHYKTMGIFKSRAANTVGGGLIWPKFKLVKDFMQSNILAPPTGSSTILANKI